MFNCLFWNQTKLFTTIDYLKFAEYKIIKLYSLPNLECSSKSGPDLFVVNF